MKRYMVVCSGEGEQWAYFTDSYQAAEDYRMNGSVSMGYRCQVYEWEPQLEEYCMIYE